MADDPVPKIEKILTTLDGTLRRRLARLGIGEPNHMIMAMAPRRRASGNRRTGSSRSR